MAGTWTDDILKERIEFYLLNGEQATLDTYGIKQDTLRRYSAEYAERFGGIDKQKDLLKIRENYSDSEIRAMANGSRVLYGMTKAPSLDFDGDIVRFAHITDTHIGSKYSHDEHIIKIIETINDEQLDFVCHTGDITEGMSGRAGHVYELSEIGYTAQRDKAVDLFKCLEMPMYLISGNHDRWYLQKADIGACICSDICERINAEFLGHDTGYVNLGNITIQLWHGGDGSSYATSYRLQKVVESLSGGTKPNVLLAGHTHKQGYFFDRNIHVVSGGSIQLQSDFMRGKRLAAHTGFHIVEMKINENGVSRFKVEWIPFYC